MRAQRVVPWMVGAMLAATLLQAGARPLTVSPGDLERFSMAESACPTFSWALVGDASLYELAVSSAGDERSVSSGGATLERTLLGQASSWSPGRDDCLVPGRRYGWSFRAQVGNEWTDWSEVRFFETPVAEGVGQSASENAEGTYRGGSVDGMTPAGGSVSQPDSNALPGGAPFGLVVEAGSFGSAIYGKTDSLEGWAGFFDGSVNVSQGLTADDLVALDNLSVQGNTHIFAALGPASYSLCMESNNGGILKRCTSSRRFKERIQPLELGGLDTVQALQPVQFHWMKGNPDLGFIAEEVAAVDPLLTTFGEQGEIEGVKYRQLTAVLVKALQEQQAELVSFRAQVERELIELRAASSCGADRPAATVRR